ncbi:MAG TPA: prepilin-type N-terminal cleavage/methylation domain-containing protein [bacterium]|nr:prepilin-type N-terminal cleavage/methylation domain-containing protein [bacterium]
MKNNFDKIRRMVEREESGFTLIEILVATTVFLLASMMFMGIFMTISNTTLRVEGNRLAQQDSRYAIEMISREIRNGKDFEVSDDGKELTYIDKDDVSYRLFTQTETDKDGNEYVVLFRQNGNITTQLTSSVVDMRDINFRIYEPANEYPSVEITMTVKRNGYEKLGSGSTVTLKTMVTSRVRE